MGGRKKEVGDEIWVERLLSRVAGPWEEKVQFAAESKTSGRRTELVWVPSSLGRLRYGDKDVEYVPFRARSTLDLAEREEARVGCALGL